MAGLCSRCGHYIFVLFLLLLFSSPNFAALNRGRYQYFSSPNLSGRRLYVYHTSTHDDCVPSANLECMVACICHLIFFCHNTIFFSKNIVIYCFHLIICRYRCQVTYRMIILMFPLAKDSFEWRKYTWESAVFSKLFAVGLTKYRKGPQRTITKTVYCVLNDDNYN